MSLETLHRLYDITLKEYEQVTFIWHGGEPLIMGISFFQKAIEMQKAYKNVKIQNRMQSNLTLLTDEMVEFLSANHFGVGTSIDGVLNDQLRGNTSTVLANRDKLLSNGQHCGFIMVLSAKNIDTLIQSYEMFKQLNANYNMNPYVSTPTEHNAELLLDAEHTIEKLIEFYEYWKTDSSCNIEVGYFERILKYILYGEKSVCKYNSCLGKWMGIRYDGDIVPCNRYFPPEYSYGNVWNLNTISEAFESEGFKKLLSEAIDRRSKCGACPIYNFCSGGCNNVALYENGISNNMGTSCRIAISIYQYIFKDVISLKSNPTLYNVNNPQIQRLLTRQRKYSDNHHDIHTDTHKG
jgi:radical SAM protein with 4Fe4S-binding SPASM domain